MHIFCQNELRISFFVVPLKHEWLARVFFDIEILVIPNRSLLWEAGSWTSYIHYTHSSTRAPGILIACCLQYFLYKAFYV